MRWGLTSIRMTEERVTAEALRYLQQLMTAKRDAEVAYQAFANMVTQAYHLGPKDSINLATGEIARVTES